MGRWAYGYRTEADWSLDLWWTDESYLVICG